MWTIFKVFVGFATILLLWFKLFLFFVFCFFPAVRHVACGTLALGPPPAMEGKS